MKPLQSAFESGFAIFSCTFVLLNLNGTALFTTQQSVALIALTAGSIAAITNLVLSEKKTTRKKTRRLA